MTDSLVTARCPIHGDAAICGCKPPNSGSRYTLAVLDNTIIDLAVEAKAARDMAQEAATRAERLETLKARLMDVRDAMRPSLDPSAPREYPYDKH